MESNLQQNFNVGFTNMKSDVLIHLTQWQYWWWFWFSLLWAFYYMMILKMVRFRSLKFRPRLATTLRPHGKWGDLIVCIIPVSWCANIITNSNFILRMIEWQSESGLLTVRIRGKQWYWVYKFELKTFTDVFTIPKNIGHNKWQISTPGDIQVADDYLHVMQLRSQNKWAKSYWEELSKEINKSKNFHMISTALSILSVEDKKEKNIYVRSIDGVSYFFYKKQFNLRLRGYFNYTGLSEIPIKDLIKDPIKVDIEIKPEVELTNTKDTEKKTLLEPIKSNIELNTMDFPESYNIIEPSIFPNFDNLGEFDNSSAVEEKVVENSVFENTVTMDSVLENSTDNINEKFEINVSENILNTNVLANDTNPEDVKKDFILNEGAVKEGAVKEGAVKEEKFKFTWSDEDRKEFADIISKNIIKKSDFLKMVSSEQMQLFFNQLNFSKRFKNLDEFINFFEFDSESGFLKTSEFDEDILHDFLKIFTDDSNVDFDNLDLLIELSNFFDTKVLPILDEKNPEYSEFFSKTNNYKIEWSEFVKMLEELSKPSSIISNRLGSNNLSDQLDYFNQLSDGKFNLNFEFYDNFLVRLFNKKVNWDESQITESLDSDMKEFISNEEIFLNRSDFIENLSNFKIKDFKNKNNPSIYNYGDFNEFDRNSRKSQGVTSPVRLIKFPISNKSNFDLSSDVIEMFRFRFNEIESATEHRLTPNSAFLIIRQKRYKRRKVILPRNLFYKDADGNTTKRVKSSNYTFLSQNSVILENDFNATKRYKFFKKNKARDELTNLVLSKRILRTRRTLVLPAHLNITAITNSFDVIHSWFIPGLGLKMDAIPGRATHHTFYIDNVGFYYGQCAEICGRYHHHMPIRICALPFEHFLLWWQSFGLPKLLFTKNFRRYSYSYGSRKYSW